VRVAALVDDGFEDSELRVPLERLRAAGHEALLLGRARGAIVHGKRGEYDAVLDVAVADADPLAFDALLLPGGRSPARLRREPAAVEFVRRFAATGRPIAAICHGPELLAEAGIVEGRTLTSWPALRAELERAGAHWVDRKLVEDGALITSRRPSDLAAFCSALLARL
jgi:protease I